jgi:ankyrin repeat protein
VGGVLVMTVVVGIPVVALILRPCVLAFERWRFEREEARVGDFEDPALRPLAEAIRARDGATLTRLLDGRPPPPGRDRAGHDLLSYALEEFQDREGALDCIRALLEAGCDPDLSLAPDGRAPIHRMITDITPGGREVVRLLLEHGADPNAVNPITGDTPIRNSGDSPDLVRALMEAGADVDRIQANGVTALVDFVARFQWESACDLVERGARLDVVNEDGLSLDYYLESWKDSVYGGHPEGWDRLRAAIAARREGPPWSA